MIRLVTCVIMCVGTHMIRKMIILFLSYHMFDRHFFKECEPCDTIKFILYYIIITNLSCKQIHGFFP